MTGVSIFFAGYALLFGLAGIGAQIEAAPETERGRLLLVACLAATATAALLGLLRALFP